VGSSTGNESGDSAPGRLGKVDCTEKAKAVSRFFMLVGGMSLMDGPQSDWNLFLTQQLPAGAD
jgi:hypothetical protein